MTIVQRSASSPLLNRYSVQFERRQVSKLLTKLTQIGDVPYCTESGGGGGDGRPFVGRRADSKKTHRSCRQVKPRSFGSMNAFACLLTRPTK